MADVQIIATDNGPYQVKGPVELYDHHGQKVTLPGPTIFLCRCGGSTNKPFCDGTHSKIGFQGAIRAVEAAESDNP